MLRHRHGLAVQLKNQFRMSRSANFGIDVLVTRDASVGTNVEIFQVAHPGRHAIRVRVIRAGVRPYPVFRRAMAGFAGDAFGHLHAMAEPFGGNRREGRMTDSAARALRGIADF